MDYLLEASMNSLMHGVHFLVNQTMQKNEDRVISELREQILFSTTSFPVIKAMKHVVPTEHKVGLPYPEPSYVFDNGNVKKG